MRRYFFSLDLFIKTINTLCCGTIKLKRSKRFNINKLDSLTTIISLIYSFNTSLAFATLGKDAGSFLGTGLAYLPFSFNLMSMWATRYSGIKGLFLKVKNLLGGNLNLAVAGDLISYRSSYTVAVGNNDSSNSSSDDVEVVLPSNYGSIEQTDLELDVQNQSSHQ